jgi:phage terminase Nu1 subunit (DNA packaging protein)
MPEINMAELATMLGCSLPTAQRLPVRYPDMPVTERGGLGKSWRFDAEAVLAFLEARKAEEEAERAARGELLAQLVLPIGRATDKAGNEISYDDQIKAAKLRKVLRDEEVESRFLVSTQEVRTALEKLLRGLATNMGAALTSIQRDHNIPEPVMAAIRAKFDNARTAFVRDAGDLLVATADDDGNFQLAAE